MNYRSKANLDIRQFARDKGVYLWQIADAYEISPETLNKRLRHELSAEDKTKMMEVIKGVADENNTGNR